MRNAFWFAIAAYSELAGCYAVWMTLRKGRNPWFAVLGIALLLLFAFALTRTDVSIAGRAFAAYAGVYIIGSLLWLRFVDGAHLVGTDVLGALLAIAGTVVILFGARAS
jgi:small multidrug resistance family-3 protein